MKKIEEVVRNYLSELPIKQNTCIICGLSGGADSVALFLALCALRKELGFVLKACHIHHGLRESADGDVRFVEELCKKQGVELSVHYVQVLDAVKETGESVEEAARRLRYEIFESLCGPEGYVALAHHLNDQVETMLFQIARGSGIKGAAGISGKRDCYIRPLLSVSKQEIIEALREIAQDWREDETNTDTTYARNRIRKEVIPALEKVNAKALSHFGQLSEELQEIETYLQQQTKKALDDTFCQGEIKKEKLLAYPGLLQNRVVLSALAETAGRRKDLGREHVAAILSLLTGQVGRQISLPYNVCAKRTYDGVKLFVKEEKVPSFLSVVLHEGDNVVGGDIWKLSKISANSEEGKELLGKAASLSSLSDNQYFSFSGQVPELVVRNRLSGDYLEVANGGHQSINQLFINQKVLEDMRDQMPLLCLGQEVLWVPGVKRGVSAYLHEEAEEIIEIRIIHKSMVK